MNEPESDGKDITENDYKLCAPIPHSLALKFESGHQTTTRRLRGRLVEPWNKRYGSGSGKSRRRKKVMNCVNIH